MLRKLRPHLSFANVTSVLALFVALGGTSAVALSGSNTVFSDDIANDNFNSPTEGQGGLVASDLRAGSVTSSEVANGTLKAEDYGIGSVSGARIQDNNVTTLDLADGAVFGNDIRDFSLNDEDVGQGTFVNFAADIGLVPANSCVYKDITGINAQGDHLLLTPNNNDSFLIYGIQYRSGQEFARLQVCNPFSFTAQDEITHFNLLVIDAQ
jgi:hypothetical protein